MACLEQTSQKSLICFRISSSSRLDNDTESRPVSWIFFIALSCRFPNTSCVQRAVTIRNCDLIFKLKNKIDGSVRLEDLELQERHWSFYLSALYSCCSHALIVASVRSFNFFAPYSFFLLSRTSYYRFIYHSIVFAFYHSIVVVSILFSPFCVLSWLWACLEPHLSHETSSILSFPTSSSLFAPQYVASSHIWPAFAPIRKSPQPPET